MASQPHLYEPLIQSRGALVALGLANILLFVIAITILALFLYEGA